MLRCSTLRRSVLPRKYWLICAHLILAGHLQFPELRLSICRVRSNIKVLPILSSQNGLAHINTAIVLRSYILTQFCSILIIMSVIQRSLISLLRSIFDIFMCIVIVIKCGFPVRALTYISYIVWKINKYMLT